MFVAEDFVYSKLASVSILSNPRHVVNSRRVLTVDGLAGMY